MEEKGLPISQLGVITNPTGEEMIPVAINESNGYVKLKNLSPKLTLEYDESSRTLKVIGISIVVKNPDKP